MYEELIEELRNLAWAYKITQNVNTKEYRLAVQAAHSIEELSKMLDEEVEINTALECSMPVWIPVTERLPEIDQEVLVCSYGHMYVCVLLQVEKKIDEREICWEDAYGYYQTIEDEEFWMPLPESPKDGEV